MDGKQIRAAREVMGWTQERLAQEVGVGMRTIGNWERGETVPQNRMAKLRMVLAAALPNPSEPDPIRSYSELALLNELMRRAVERGQNNNGGALK